VRLAFLSLLVPSLALAMPVPMRPEKGGGLVNVRVRRITEVKPTSSTAPPPTTALQGKHRLLVVLADTADSPWPQGYSRARYEELLFSKTTESMAEFWRENSYGAYQLEGEVVGPIRAPGRMSDYAYDRADPNGKDVAKLIAFAVDRAARDTDLASFDTHDARGKKKPDGVIDHLMVIYAERTGAHDGFAPIWPHRGSLDASTGGHRIGSYTILNHAARLGVYVHEFGHDLGLPDLYDRDYSSHGAGEWCTMASGSWLGSAGTPAHVSAWAKMRLGWITPAVVSEASSAIDVPSSSEKPFALRIPLGEIDSPEYFVVENRRKIGFDRELAAEGILIWHVDERKGHNDDEGRKLVDVVEATEIQDLDRLDPSEYPKHAPDVFSSGGRARFADDTDPSARSTDGGPSEIEVKVLTPAQRVMRVAVARPKIFDPGGVPFVLSRDGYNYGRFATVPVGPGSEALMPLDATPGGFLAFAAEAFVSGRPGTREPIEVRVYSDGGGAPRRVLAERSISFEVPSEGYGWARARLGDGERALELEALQRVWVGITSKGGDAYPVMNPFSTSKEARYRRKQSDRAIESTFHFREGVQPASDYVIRLSGFGYVAGADRPEPRANDSDELVLRMRALDAIADQNRHEEALRGYETLLADMEKDARKYEAWIPVVTNSIGVAAYELRRYDAAIPRFEASLRRALAAGDKANAADLYENIGETAFYARDSAKAIDACRRSLALNEKLARGDRLVENLYWLGRAHQVSGKADDGKSFLERAIVATRDAFAKDADAEREWLTRIQRAIDGRPEDEPNVEKRTDELETKGKKQKAVYTDLLQFLADDTAADQ
jgi:M6 family metalloprotease-like protein